MSKLQKLIRIYLVLVIPVLWLLGIRSVYAQSTFYTAVGDTYTSFEDPDDNFSDRNFLSVSQWGNESFLAFTGIDTTDMQTAYLLLEPTTAGGTVDVHGTTAFDETLVTDNNHPVIGALIASSGTLQADVVVEIDITSYVTSSDVYVALTSSDDVTLRSSNAFDPDKPRIRIDRIPEPTATPIVTVTPEPSPVPDLQQEMYEIQRQQFEFSIFAGALIIGILALSFLRIRQ